VQRALAALGTPECDPAKLQRHAVLPRPGLSGLDGDSAGHTTRHHGQ
jgi:hypothetical protein